MPIFDIQSTLKCLLYFHALPEPVNAVMVIVTTYVITCLVVWLFWIVRSYCRSSRLIYSDPDRMWKLQLSLIAVSYLFYSRIFDSWARLFNCVAIDPRRTDYRLAGALYIKCWTSEHFLILRNVAVPCGAVFVIGLPLFAFYQMYRQRKNLDANESMLRTYGFIYR
jgi:steroid 5-alpha reductase family enzyme